MRKISWDKHAVNQFRNALNFIRKDSFQNAEKVKREILEKIDGLMQLPEKYSPDKYKINNTGSYYRAFELHHYWISYFISTEEIIITRIRHISMEPQNY